MPFEIVRNDLVNMHVDAIVNTANPRPVVGGGVDGALHHRAGAELLEARKKIGDIAVGEAKLTPAFALHANYVIHTVGPMWDGGGVKEAEHLRNCYVNSLNLAAEHRCESIAFPLISTGTYGFPKDLALQIAISAISGFLLEHEMMVYLVVFDKNAYALSEKLFKEVESFIDENYVEDVYSQEYFGSGNRRGFLTEASYSPVSSCMPAADSCVREKPMPYRAKRSLKDLLDEVEDTFSESLLRWIVKKNMKNPDVYKRANMDRKLFSKILNNKDYKPSKLNAIALSIALELNLDETKDFIGRAGYALTHSSKFDIIIEYFISQEIYDVFEINEVLFAFDQPLIGG